MHKKTSLILFAVGIFLIVGFFLYDHYYNKYRVKFNSDGGSSVSTALVEKGNTVLKPANPTKEGYAFGSWQLNGQDFDFKTVITNNITLKAKWKKIYNVIATLDGKEYTITKVEGETLYAEEFNFPPKGDYSFINLYYEDGTDYDSSIPVTSDLKLVAKYLEYNFDYEG